MPPIRKPLRRSLITAALAALLAPAAFAQALIDQNKVLAGSVTPGDAPGFPLTISQPGSYKLTSNLYVPAGSDGIQITADNVTLDLNGFTVLGTATCSQNGSTLAVTCSQMQGNGVYAEGRKHAAVKNGTVRGFGFACISAGLSGRLEDLSLGECDIGITQLGTSGHHPVHVARADIQMVRRHGISVIKGLITDSTVSSAGFYGISGNISALSVSVHGGHVRSSGGGVEYAAMRGVMVERNKISVSNVVSAGGNLVNGAPF